MKKVTKLKEKNNVYVVLENEFDFDIINQIIKGNTETNLDYFVGSGYSSALSMARSLFLKDPKSKLILEHVGELVFRARIVNFLIRQGGETGV